MRRFEASKLLSSTLFSLWAKKTLFAWERRCLSLQAGSALSRVPDLVSSSGFLDRSLRNRAMRSVGPSRSRSWELSHFAAAFVASS